MSSGKGWEIKRGGLVLVHSQSRLSGKAFDDSVLTLLRARCPECMTAELVAERMQNTRQAIAWALNRLVARGSIVRVHTPGGKCYYRARTHKRAVALAEA